MDMDIIEKAKQTLPDFEGVMSKINQRRDEFGDDWERYVTACLRREMKKITMHPSIEEEVITIGVDIKDWGKIMRKKYNSAFYPEGDTRAGQLIPESDITYTYYFHNGKEILRINSKEDYISSIGKIAKIKHQPVKRNILELNIRRDVEEEELNKLQGIPVMTLKEIQQNIVKTSTITDYRDRPLIRIKNVNVLELRGNDDLMIVSADDDSVKNDDFITMTLFCDRKLLNFTEDAMGIDVYGFPNKTDEGQINVNVLGVIVRDERFKLKEKPKPIKDIW